MSTSYHSLYWAHALTLRGTGASVDGISRSLASARVDLNPHQVDAALFAVRSPLSRGVLLADEVGLGKTIEAGIVIAQKWAERRRRILLILPATLRKQWEQELAEKFGLPGLIIDGPIFNAQRKAGVLNPLDSPGQVMICSYQFAASREAEIRSIAWDLVVIDEAHRMRNVYKTSSKTARSIKDAIEGRSKLLLTATPLQNSLMELYGLVSVIDPHVFGDERSFKEQFVRGGVEDDERNVRLRERLAPICTRTLRKQVLEYISFTQRIPLTQEFVPHDDEQRLYELVSDYLQRDSLAALPNSQRALMTLVLRKLLASSTFAIAGTLWKLVHRLEAGAVAAMNDDDFDALEEMEEEWNGDEEEGASTPPREASARELTAGEIAELRNYAELAAGISDNAKGTALLTVLETAFDKATELGALRKAVVFTESRRTQKYLLDLLGRNGYAGELVLMNGTNTDPESKQVYQRWLERHAGSGAASGSRSADTKAAIVEEFRDHATIMIATESAAEGVNLQFCSLVVNYDLPWNPQRVEQRIGRCHRYGQKHDVVVVNFLNKKNAADQRVYELLAQKFKLFSGVFGASDEVLGALESGVDLERRIAQIYQQCRSEAEIKTAFDTLQADLTDKISARMATTRESLLDNFDEEVHARLKVHRDQAQAALDERQRWLLALTRQELADEAVFEADAPRFEYVGQSVRHGCYNMDWRDAEERGDTFYRLDQELATAVVERAQRRELAPATLLLDYDSHGASVSALQPFRGRGGWLEASKLTVSSLQTEEFLILAGCADDGEQLDDELCQKLLSLPARTDGVPSASAGDGLVTAREQRISELRSGVSARNQQHFDEEIAKLDHWADDMRFGLERELKDLGKLITEARRATRGAASLEDKLAAQKQVRNLEQQRARKRRDLFVAEDELNARRDEMIAAIERQLTASDTLQHLFAVRWQIS